MKKLGIIAALGAAAVAGAIVGIPQTDAADLTLDAETTAALADVVAEYGGTAQDHIKARAMEMKAAADRNFQGRAFAALLYMRANPTVGYGPQGAKWAQVKAALLAAEAALKAEEPE